MGRSGYLSAVEPFLGFGIEMGNVRPRNADGPAPRMIVGHSVGK